jgi:hypothetical protein
VGDAMAAQSVHRTTADEPDQTGCHEGPTIHFDRPPCRSPRPSPHWISVVGREADLLENLLESWVGA